MNDSQYHRATQIKEQLDKIERMLNYFHRDERHLLEIAVSDDSVDYQEESMIHEHLPVTRQMQIKLHQMLIDYKNELETEFEEL